MSFMALTCKPFLQSVNVIPCTSASQAGAFMNPINGIYSIVVEFDTVSYVLCFKFIANAVLWNWHNNTGTSGKPRRERNENASNKRFSEEEDDCSRAL